MRHSLLSSMIVCILSTCLVGELVHGCLILGGLAASLAQDITFLPWVLALLLLPQICIGGVCGAVAVAHGLRRSMASVVAIANMFLGILCGFFAIVFASHLSPPIGRPFVQYIGWYSITLTIVGTTVGSLCLLIIARLRDHRTKTHLP